MLYRFECVNCKEVYDDIQGINDIHIFTCPVCLGQCRRIFTVPLVKKNEGFYSDTLGRWVDSHTDFEEGLQQTRYETDQSKWLDDNKTPKDEWVERKTRNLEERRKRVKNELEYSQEQNYAAQE
jgi:predicted nucleic acid-binding Zn ribbon protein